MKKKLSINKMRKMLWLMGVVKIPIIAYVRPKLIFIDEESVQVKIRLRRRTKNHLKSMYFGALAVGADVTAGLHSFYFSEMQNAKISFAFKGVKASFFKRATSDVIFSTSEGLKTKALFELALSEKERKNDWITVDAKNMEGEIVASFQMEISVKVKG